MHKHDVMNILSGSRYKTYLEIGVDWGTTFNQVTISDKVGVDPLFKVPESDLNGRTYNITSDDFFARDEQKFDCVFIDGLHTYEQSKRDFLNAWERLTPGGVIVLDDCYPADDLSALPDLDACLQGRRDRGEPNNMTWMGDVYKTAIWIHDCTDYAFAYVDESFGTVVVWQDKQPRKKRLFANEAEIAACDFAKFKTLSLPTLPLRKIASKVNPKPSILSRLFG